MRALKPVIWLVGGIIALAIAYPSIDGFLESRQKEQHKATAYLAALGVTIECDQARARVPLAVWRDWNLDRRETSAKEFHIACRRLLPFTDAELNFLDADTGVPLGRVSANGELTALR